MRKIASLAFVLALTAAACGGNTGDTTTTSTTSAPETTTTPAPTTTAPPASTVDATVFFMQDSGGNEARPGPFLIAVHRDVSDEDLLVATLETWLDGPTAEEEDAGISSAVPDGTQLLSVTVEDGVASVDLSSEFESGGGTLSMFSRLAQLVYTATTPDGVDSVQILLDGDPVTVFSGEGIELAGPQTREDYQDLLPGILVEEPAWGETVAPTFDVSGIAAAFEAVFQLEITDRDGAVIAGPPFVQTDSGTGWGNFALTIELPDDAPTELVIHVWEDSAKDGSPVSERFIPIHLAES